jgi:hypothetical protein
MLEANEEIGDSDGEEKADGMMRVFGRSGKRSWPTECYGLWLEAATN